MNRICVINVPGLSRRVLSADNSLWMASGLKLRTLVPVFPSLPMSMMASLTTGVEPAVHGVISGGVFCRQKHDLDFREHSNTLLTKKRFWDSRHLPRRPRTVMLFWGQPLAGGSDYALGGYSYADGEIPEFPPGLHRQLNQQLGPSQFELLHGPLASWRPSEWIAAAAGRLWRDLAPDLLLVRLPGVDFEIERYGVGSPAARAALREMDRLACRLAQAVLETGGQYLLLSDSAYVDVSRTASPNRLLRQAGLLQVRQSDVGEEVDLERSRAFVLVDHQVGHLYCEESLAREAADIVARDHAVAAVLPRAEVFATGRGLERAGERIVLAQGDAWLDYAWWPGEDVPRRLGAKCGYDPCELQETCRRNAPAIAASLGLVEGVSGSDKPVMAASFDLPQTEYRATDVPELLRAHLFEEVTSDR